MNTDNNIFRVINEMNIQTETELKIFFETVEKMSLSELRELFEKEIGAKNP